MAGINKDAKGWRVTFVMESRKKSIRLGMKSNKAQARGIALRIDHLVGALDSRQTPDPQTQQWVRSLPDKLFDKLANAGLVAARTSNTLNVFLLDYIAKSKVKESTKEHYDRVRKDLVDFFGPDISLRSVTVATAKDFRHHLLDSVGENTCRRRCGRAKQFFKDALLRGHVDLNPFDGQKVSVGASKRERIRFVTLEEAGLINDACPDAQWRLIFALNRFAGMRCPSEVLHVKWDDVNWSTNQITFRSMKTEHHEGGETRTIPIFPELVQPLLEVQEQAPPGTQRVISRYQPGANLRTQFNRIVKRAGITPWPKPFQNLRSTRETELAAKFPIHVVCDWIGNSVAVAMKHYLQVTEDHFKQATQEATEKVATMVAPQAREIGRTEQNAKKRDTGKTLGFPVSSGQFASMQDALAPPRGLEPLT